MLGLGLGLCFRQHDRFRTDHLRLVHELPSVYLQAIWWACMRLVCFYEHMHAARQCHWRTVPGLVRVLGLLLHAQWDKRKHMCSCAQVEQCSVRVVSTLARDT